MSEEAKYTEVPDTQEGLRNWHIINQDIKASAYSKKKQVLATFFVTLGCLLNGSVIGYTSPAIPSLRNGTTVFGGKINLSYQEASWMTGLLSLGCFFGCVLAGPIMERLGRRLTLMLVASGSYASGFLFIIVAQSAELLYFGRFCNGIGLGVVLATVSVYIVEIATIDMRGFLGCFVQFLGSVGVLFIFSVGCVLNWWQLALANLAMVPVYVIAMYFVPESPRWLIMKGNEWAGEVSLKWLRGRGAEELDREIEVIKREIRVRRRERVSITQLLDPDVVKPFIISMMMMFFLQMSGFNVMVFYCAIIFQKADSSISPAAAGVIVALVLLVSCFVALGVVSQLSRKLMLVTSIFGMAVCHFTLGACYYLREQHPDESYNIGWLPLAAVIGFLFLGNVGYGTLIWVVTAELLPPKVRAVANSFIICFAFITGFIVAKTFIDLIESPLGESGTFWLYGSVCFIGGLFTLIFVPETRNKSVEEIQQYFRGKRSEKEKEAEAGTPMDVMS